MKVLLALILRWCSEHHMAAWLTHSLRPPRSGLVWSQQGQRPPSQQPKWCIYGLLWRTCLQRVSDSSQGSVSQDVAAFMLASLVNKGFGFFWKCFSFARQVLYITKVCESWDDDVIMMGSRTMTVALWVLDVDWRSGGTNWGKTLETSGNMSDVSTENHRMNDSVIFAVKNSGI